MLTGTLTLLVKTLNQPWLSLNLTAVDLQMSNKMFLQSQPCAVQFPLFALQITRNLGGKQTGK